jgi:hypothetical protein
VPAGSLYERGIRVDELIATGVLRRLLAFTEQKFSNAMIEAWWRAAIRDPFVIPVLIGRLDDNAQPSIFDAYDQTPPARTSDADSRSGCASSG